MVRVLYTGKVNRDARAVAKPSARKVCRFLPSSFSEVYPLGKINYDFLKSRGLVKEFMATRNK